MRSSHHKSVHCLPVTDLTGLLGIKMTYVCYHGRSTMEKFAEAWINALYLIDTGPFIAEDIGT